MFVLIFVAIAVIILVFVVVVALQPSDFRIARALAIFAPTAVVFDQVNDLHKWEAWSPWVKMDPTAEMIYDGPPAGVGASYTWVGNNKVGEGCSTIIESRPGELVRLRLDFVRPFKITHTAEFSFKPVGKQTVATWSLTGKNNFMAKAFGLFVNCDKMIGDEFVKGLMQMKLVSEALVRK